MNFDEKILLKSPNSIKKLINLIQQYKRNSSMSEK